jgi:threonine dehydrogenase-like Zn-dependent dehydrogenase
MLTSGAAGYGVPVRAVTVLPQKANSLELSDVPEPTEADGNVLVDVLAVGICGTDAEIMAGEYGEAPPGHDRLVLGHESLGRVRQAPPGADVAEGDLVACIVRSPDPVPCANCAAGQWDMCSNGRYTEHGIKGLDGFMRERYRASADRLVGVDQALGLAGVLMEPTSIVAKAWAEIDRFAGRDAQKQKVALVTGAGPVGLLAALLGVQRGLDVHVLDQVTDGPKPDLVRNLGAQYHCDGIENIGVDPDIAVECTGVASVVLGSIEAVRPNGITCLTGVSSPGRSKQVDLGGLNRALVLENNLVFGSVNANRSHWEAAARALQDADRGWLEELITGRVPMDDVARAFQRGADDVKVVLEIGDLP